MKRNIGILAALAGVVILIVLLFLAPISPVSKAVAEPNDHTEPDGHSEIDHEIEKAIELVNGGSPMEGITLLRSLAEEHPDEPMPQFYLGLFSMQSGQFDKAIVRFERVIVLEPSLLSAYTYLAEAHIALGNQEKAIEVLEILYGKLDNEEEKTELLQYIEELKTLNKKSTNE